MPARAHGQGGNGTTGAPRTRAYSSWANMLQRCLNPKHPDFHRYGGRGITVCAAWACSFKAFFADMGERPKGTTLERKKNDVGYMPGNCVWAAHQRQCRNQGRTVMVEIDGVTKPRIEWCEQYGISEAVVRARINRNKWGPVKAITTPVQRRGQDDKGRLTWHSM